jgi:hypothetical protein
MPDSKFSNAFEPQVAKGFVRINFGELYIPNQPFMPHTSIIIERESAPLLIKALQEGIKKAEDVEAGLIPDPRSSTSEQGKH